MKQVELVAESRTQTGSRISRRLRREGRLPVNLYGHGEAPESLHVAARELETALRHHAMFIKMRVDGKDQPAVVHALQHDPITQELLHADFIRVSATEKIEVSVALKIHGPSKGESAGGILLEQQGTVKLRCLPTNIPTEIEVDVRELDIHDSVHIEDLVLPEGVEPAEEPSRVLISITEPRFGVEEKAEDTGEEGAGEGEPEVIGKPEEEPKSD